jgi:hypothetical protein
MSTRLFYISGLIITAISIFLIIEFPESNRLNMIAGALTAVGFGLNIAGYSMLSDKVKTTK